MVAIACLYVSSVLISRSLQHWLDTLSCDLTEVGSLHHAVPLRLIRKKATSANECHECGLLHNAVDMQVLDISRELLRSFKAHSATCTAETCNRYLEFLR
jgi:hypothetical protein